MEIVFICINILHFCLIILPGKTSGEKFLYSVFKAFTGFTVAAFQV